MSELRQLPSVEQLLQTHQAAEYIAAYGRPLTLEALRLTLAELRQKFNEQDTLPKKQGIVLLAGAKLRRCPPSSSIGVINGSGLVLQNNLGPAPLSQAALQSVQTSSRGY